MSRCLSLLSLPWLFFIASAEVSAEENPGPQPWQWMLGSHTNYQHTLRNPESGATPLLYDVQRMDDVNAEGIVLLSQQAYLFAADAPLRRRIYQFIQRRDGWIQHIFDIDAELPKTQVNQQEYWRPLHGCSIRWQQQGDHFVGNNQPQHCYFFIEQNGERVAVSSEINLFPDYFVINDNFELAEDSEVEGIEKNAHTEYQRTNFYDISVGYSAHSDDQWEVASPTAQLHDQGARVGLVLEDSGLELRYQIELQRTLSELTFTVHDLSRSEVMHEQIFPADTDLVEYNSARLRIRLKPRP